MKDKKILYITGIVLLFLMSVGLSYAYFSSSISGNADSKDMVVEAGTLKLTYTDSKEIVMENIKPGGSITKEVTVENTGTLETAYNIIWQELTNEIINDEMTISATCKRINGDVEEGTCEGVEETAIKKLKVKENVSIEPNITHEYTITITFKETGENQNYNQGKAFSGVLGISEYKVPETVYCTFDGEMVQGAEYVNGQYTYKYRQQMEYSSSYELTWTNITDDGWGVQLTDKTSTEAVTSKLCTYINGKPIVSMVYMFNGSQATTLDLSSFDTSNVTNMEAMFYNSKATTLDLSYFDTSKVTNMRWMFCDSQATTLDLSSFDTSNVTNMYGMFMGSEATTLDLSRFNTSNVTDMSAMFQETKVTTLDLSSFDTSNVTNMEAMFYNSKATTLDLSSFDTSKVTNMMDMFRDSQAITIDLSSFDTSNVTNMVGMFNDSTNLKTIYASEKFNTDNFTDTSVMFLLCTSLVGGAGTKYDSTKLNKTYARIDGGTSSPGYFTSK